MLKRAGVVLVATILGALVGWAVAGAGLRLHVFGPGIAVGVAALVGLASAGAILRTLLKARRGRSTARSSAERDYEPYTQPPERLTFSVSGSFTPDGGVEVTDVRQEMSWCRIGGPSSEADLILLDESDHELARGSIEQHIGFATAAWSPTWKPEDGVGCRPFVSSGFTAVVPALDGGVALRLTRGDQILWTRRAPGPKPRVHSLSCEIEQHLGRIVWSDDAAGDADYEAHAEFRASADDRWVWLNARPAQSYPAGVESLRTGALEFDVTEVPPGAVSVRVAVSDGFHTVHSEPVRVDVAKRPLEIVLEAPAPGIVPEGWGRLTLSARAHAWRGGGFTVNGAIRDPQLYRWLIDDQHVGNGPTIHIDPPALGAHEVTVVVGASGEETRKSARFEMTAALIATLETAREQVPAMRRQFPQVDWKRIDAEQAAMRTGGRTPSGPGTRS